MIVKRLFNVYFINSPDILIITPFTNLGESLSDDATIGASSTPDTLRTISMI